MLKLRIGSPIRSSINIDGWESIAVFDQRRVLFSIVTGICTAFVMSLILIQLNSMSLPIGTPSLSEIISVIAILTIGHEALHLLGFPSFGLNSNTVFGIWPQFGSPYVQYILPMTRNRFLLSSILPFIFLTLLPIFLIALGIGSTPHLSWISVLNSIGVGSDIFIFFKIFSSAPSNSCVVENGEDIAWLILKK